MIGAIAAHYVESAPALTYADIVLADNPVLYYRLGEASGFTMNDSSPNAHAGGIYGTGAVNAPTLGTAGLIAGDSNTAATFNGTTQFAQVPSGTAADTALKAMSPAFSVEVWVNIVTTITFGYLDRYGTGGSTVSSWILYQVSGKPTFILRNAANADVTCQAPNILSTGVKHHIVGTYDGTNIRLYVDGSLVQTAASTFSSHNRSPKLVIGEFDVTNAFFRGVMDEIAVYPSALSAGQVAAHYAAGA